MTTAESCEAAMLHEQGREIAMTPFGSERGWYGRGQRCGDCGVRRGGFHHLGCDIQRCPLCAGQMFSCGCRFDEDGADELEDELDDEPLHVDRDGILVERRVVDGLEIIVHYDDIPPSDITVLDGLRVTTALRTVIDIAADVDRDHLERILADVLERELFTIEDARRRLAEPDMERRVGAELLRGLLGTFGVPDV